MFNISSNDVIEPLGVPLTTGSRTLFSQHKTSSYLCWGSTNWVFVKHVDRIFFFFFNSTGRVGERGWYSLSRLKLFNQYQFLQTLEALPIFSTRIKAPNDPAVLLKIFSNTPWPPSWMMHSLTFICFVWLRAALLSFPSFGIRRFSLVIFIEEKKKKKQPCCQWLALSPANRCCSLPLQARDFRRASELVDSVVSTVPCFVGWTRRCFLKIYLMSIKKKHQHSVETAHWRLILNVWTLNVMQTAFRIA